MNNQKPVWAVIVDGDCEGITKSAHLMVVFDDRDIDIDERIPACGQRFRAGWLHSWQEFRES